MTDPYLFERGIGQQMGDLCRLAVGDAKVTQTGDIVTLEDMPGRGAFGVSVEVPYTSGGVQSVNVERCGKNLLDFAKIDAYAYMGDGSTSDTSGIKRETELLARTGLYFGGIYWKGFSIKRSTRPVSVSSDVTLMETTGLTDRRVVLGFWYNLKSFTVPFNTLTHIVAENLYPSAEYIKRLQAQPEGNSAAYRNLNCTFTNIQIELGATATTYEPYNGDTYTITLPTTIYGGTVDLTKGTVTSIYAADGSLLPDPVVTEIDPISISILAGVNNIWADVGTVTVSYYAADAETFLPALWYPTIYRGLTSARYLIKRASGAIASFSDAVAAPLVGLRVALPWRSEGYQAVEVTQEFSLLPPTYRGVEYLDSGSSRAQIDTLVSGDVDVRIVAMTQQSGNIGLLIGSGADASQYIGATTIWTLGGGVDFSASSLSWTDISASFRRGLVTATISGETKSRTGGASSGTYKLFGVGGYPVNAKIKNCIISHSSEILRNFIPCYQKSDNASGMYDTVTGSFFENSAFTAGANKDYLEQQSLEIPLPTTIYGGYLDVVTGQLVATHDENGNLLTNQKLYFLDPVNVSALAGVNNIWSDAGDVAVSYRIDNG